MSQEFCVKFEIANTSMIIVYEKTLHIDTKFSLYSRGLCTILRLQLILLFSNRILRRCRHAFNFRYVTVFTSNSIQSVPLLRITVIILKDVSKMFTCPYCQKIYKSQNWTHLLKCVVEAEGKGSAGKLKEFFENI